MANKNQVTVTFGGDADQLDKAAAKAAKATDGVGDAATKAAKQTGSYTDKMAKLSVISIGATNAVDEVTGVVSDLTSIQRDARDKALAHSRALLDVEQAGQDMNQALQDAEQATRDLKQAQIDSQQAAVDQKQAYLDQKQAALDIETAQRDYNDAVKEYGKNSPEAKQAALDLEQAQTDLAQAGVDVTQAQEDAQQAADDAKQAQLDQNQAAIDGKTAQQDLMEAMADAQDTASGWQSTAGTVGSAMAGISGTVGLLVAANGQAAFSAVTSAAKVVGAWILMGVQALVNAARIAVAWLIALGPIGWIIAAVGLVGAAFAILWFKSSKFRDFWITVWGGIKAAAKAVGDWFAGPFVHFFTGTWDKIVGFVKGMPGKITSAAKGMWDGIKNAFRSAINWVIDKWNNFSIGIPAVDTHIPGIGKIGGFTLNTPNIPRLHSGGVVPGTPGQEVLSLLQAGETVTPRGGTTDVTLHISGSGTFASMFLEAVRTRQVQLSVHGGRVAVNG